VSDRFRVSGGYAYNNAEYTDFVTIDKSTLEQNVVNYKGNKLNRSPENKINLGASYFVPLGDNGSLTFSAIYSWVDDQYTNPGNSENGMIESYDRADARMTWTSASDKLAVTAFVKNISDDRATTDASGGTIADGFLRTVHLGIPRMYGLQLNYRF